MKISSKCTNITGKHSHIPYATIAKWQNTYNRMFVHIRSFRLVVCIWMNVCFIFNSTIPTDAINMEQRQLYNSVNKEAHDQLIARYEKVSLLPFQIWIEFISISSSDVLFYAMNDYILNRTRARTVELFQKEINVPASVTSSTTNKTSNTETSTFQYNGTATVSTENGTNGSNVSQGLFQHEQRMILLDPTFELFLQNYFEQAMFPYKSNIYVRGVQIILPPTDTAIGQTAPPRNVMDDYDNVAWNTIAIFSASGAAGCAMVLVLLTFGIVTYRKYYGNQLRAWTYNVERERNLVPGVQQRDHPQATELHPTANGIVDCACSQTLLDETE
jgi:hypothetical protein